MDIWYGFACHGIDLLRPQGVLCFIAQNNWTTSSGAKKLRYKVTKDTEILQLLDFNTYMVFEDADIQTMIMMFRRTRSKGAYEIDYRQLLPGAAKIDMLALLSKQLTKNTQFLYARQEKGIPADSPLTFSRSEDTLNKIRQGKVYLLDDEVAQGIVFPQDFLDNRGQVKLGKHNVGDGIFGLTDAEYLAMQKSLNDKEMKIIKPYFTSSEIKKYYTNPRNHLWLIYTDSSYNKPNSMNDCPTLKAHLDEFQAIITSSNKPYGLHRARKESFFIGEKILSLRKCVGTQCFSYSDFDCYVTQTYFVIQTRRWNMHFLTGVLNSKLITFWLRAKGKMQGSNFQIDKEPLTNIPLPAPDSINAELEQEIISLVDKILSTKSHSLQADISSLEREIDRLVYKIYGLTDEEIKIVEG